MPGIISDMFQPDEGETQNQQTTTIAGEGETGVEASPSVGIGLSGSYEDADGTTHEWSNDTAVGTDIDLDAAIDTSTTVAHDLGLASE